MARTIALDFKIDGLVESSKNINDLGTEVKDLNKSFESMNVSDKFENLKKEVDAGGLSMRQLSKKIQEYQSIALEAGRTSPIGKAALLEAANLQDIVTDLRNEVTRLSSDGKNMQGALQVGGSVIAGYGALQGVMAMTGVENESLVKSIQKMQAAQSILTAIEQIRLSVEKESAAMMFLRTAQTKIATVAQTVYTAVIGTSTGAKTAEVVATGAATTAQWSLNAAISANPIGLIVIGIAAAVAAFIYFKDTILNLIKVAFYPLILAFESIKSGLQALGLIQSEEAKKLEKVESEKAAKLKQLHEERMKLIDEEIIANRERGKVIGDGIDFEIAKLEAAGKDATALKREKIENDIATTAEEIRLSDLRVETQIKELEILQKIGGFVSEAATQKLKELEDERKAMTDNLTQLENSLVVFDIKQTKITSDGIKQRSDERKKERDAELEAERKHQEELFKLKLKQIEDDIKIESDYETFNLNMMSEGLAKDIEANRLAFRKKQEQLTEFLDAGIISEEEYTAKQKEISAQLTEAKKVIEEKYREDELALAEEYRLRQLDDEALELEKLKIKFEEEMLRAGENNELKLALEKEYLKNKGDLEEEAEQKAANRKFEIALKGINATKQLTSDLFTFTNILGAQDEKSKLVRAKRQFDISKSLSLAEATVTGRLAIMDAYKNGMKNPVPLLGPATGIAYATLAGLTSAANIAQIASTKFGGGGGGSSPSASAPSGGGGSAPTSVPAPQTNFFGTAGESSTSTDTQESGTRQQPTLQVSVGVSEITNTQNQITRYEERAAFNEG